MSDWPSYSAEERAKREALGIITLRQRVDAEINKSWHQIPTDIIVGVGKLIGLVPQNAVVYLPEAGGLRFSIPNVPEFSEYSIAALERSIISEIPGTGKYLKHGWRDIHARSADYAFVLRRTGPKGGKTSLHVLLAFSFLPTSNLAQAQALGFAQRTLGEGQLASW